MKSTLFISFLILTLSSKLQKSPAIDSLVNNFSTLANSTDPEISCPTCEYIVKTGRILFQNDKTKSIISKIAIKACRASHILTDRVCQNTVLNFIDSIVDAAAYKILDPYDVCFYLNYCPLKKTFLNSNEYANQLFIDKPPRIDDLSHEGDTFKIIQLTDFHVDPRYTAVFK